MPKTHRYNNIFLIKYMERIYIATRQKGRDNANPSTATLLRNLVLCIRTCKENGSNNYKIFWKKPKKVVNLLTKEKHNNFKLPEFDSMFENKIDIHDIPDNSVSIKDWKFQIFDSDKPPTMDIKKFEREKKNLFEIINACRYHKRLNIQRNPRYTDLIPNNIKNKYIDCFKEIKYSKFILNEVNVLAPNKVQFYCRTQCTWNPL